MCDFFYEIIETFFEKVITFINYTYLIKIRRKKNLTKVGMKMNECEDLLKKSRDYEHSDDFKRFKKILDILEKPEKKNERKIIIYYRTE